MTAGRIALGPIGAAASLLALPLGAAVAGNRERNYIELTKEASDRMNSLEGILDRSRTRLLSLQPQMAVTTADIQRHTSQLETTEPDTPEAQGIAHRLDIDMRKAATLKNELLEIVKERDDAMKSAGIAKPD